MNYPEYFTAEDILEFEREFNAWLDTVAEEQQPSVDSLDVRKYNIGILKERSEQ